MRIIKLSLLMVLSHLLFCSAYREISAGAIQRHLESYSLRNTLHPQNGTILRPLLRPRPSGNNKEVREFIKDYMSKLFQWKLEEDIFSQETLVGNIEFTNLIYRRDPIGVEKGNIGYLTLAAHYDSKVLPLGFIGATDSAVPVGVLMYLATALDTLISNRYDRPENVQLDEYFSLDDEEARYDIHNLGVQIIFFDGEEAFKDWTATDSIYGSRHLAEKWESEPFSPNSLRHNKIDSIDLMVLLDLLGAASPRIPSFMRTTHWAYNHMSGLEFRLRDAKVMRTETMMQWLYEGSEKASDFQSHFIEDDHLPFLKKGVEVLHLIAVPFPAVWHNMNDDAEHLDEETVYDWARLMTGFVAEYLELELSMPSTTPSAAVGGASGDL